MAEGIQRAVCAQQRCCSCYVIGQLNSTNRIMIIFGRTVEMVRMSPVTRHIPILAQDGSAGEVGMKSTRALDDNISHNGRIS